jgi:hypothetical protein
MNQIPHFKIYAVLFLLLVAMLLARSFFKRDKDSSSAIKLDDLLVDPLTGKISKAAAVLMGSFAISSWVIIYITLTGKLTDVLFAAYLAVYATPAVVKIIGDKGATAPTVNPP